MLLAFCAKISHGDDAHRCTRLSERMVQGVPSGATATRRPCPGIRSNRVMASFSFDKVPEASAITTDPSPPMAMSDPVAPGICFHRFPVWRNTRPKVEMPHGFPSASTARRTNVPGKLSNCLRLFDHRRTLPAASRPNTLPSRPIASAEAVF